MFVGLKLVSNKGNNCAKIHVICQHTVNAATRLSPLSKEQKTNPDHAGVANTQYVPNTFGKKPENYYKFHAQCSIHLGWPRIFIELLSHIL